MSPYARRRRCRGTIIIFFLVMVSILTTSLLTTMALTSGVGTQMASLTLKRDQAYYAAEAGIQNGFWVLQNNNNWRAAANAPFVRTIGNAAFSLSAVGDWNSPILLTSVGTVSDSAGNIIASSTVTAVVSPSVIVPAITLGNNFDNNGNVTINGDVQAKGNISTSGRLNENGSLYAGGTVTTKGSVDISGATNPNTPNITIPNIDMNWLKTNATQIVNVPSGSKTYEVTSLNLGNGGIVYFTGPVQFKGNVSITGTGTVVVEGDMSVKSAASFGSSSQPANANIVTSGNLDISGYLGVVGSIYATGAISKNGGFDVTGVIVGQSDLNTSGGMTITRAQPPAFDPRSQVNGVGTMVLSRVTGPIF